MPSLIICNVHTIKGRKTFTLRWDSQALMTWEKIFYYISTQGGLSENHYTIKIGKKYIKYSQIYEILPFDIANFAFNNEKGLKTSIGLLKTNLNLKLLKELTPLKSPY